MSWRGMYLSEVAAGRDGAEYRDVPKVRSTLVDADLDMLRTEIRQIIRLRHGRNDVAEVLRLLLDRQRAVEEWSK